MNNFYKLFEKIQKLKEQDEMNKPSDAGMQPSITGADVSSDDSSMQLGAKNNVPAEIEDVPDAEDSDNLSLPEGSIDFDKIMMDLSKIKKMIPKFKSMDKDKGDQLEDLLKQTSNLVSSFSPEGEEEPESSESEDQGADNLMKDKEPSFGDEQGPPVKQTADMEDMSKDMSSEMPAMSPPDQMQQ